MLFGDIVVFGRDDVKKGTGVGGGGVAPVGRYGSLVGLGGGLRNVNQEAKAVVAINLRIVDAETGETLETAEARGESIRKSKNFSAVLGGGGIGGAGGGGAGEGMNSSNFQSTIIGEATQDAVNKIVEIIEQKIPQIGAKSRTIEGTVSNIDGCTLYISVGGNDGVHVGDHFEIHKIIKDVIDIQTKEVLDKQTVKVGDFIVGTVRDKVSIGQYGGESLSPKYEKGYAARMATQ